MKRAAFALVALLLAAPSATARVSGGAAVALVTAETENQLCFSRQYYNDACATLNRTMVTIPWSLFVGMSGVDKGVFYDAPDGHNAPPTVSFGN